MIYLYKKHFCYKHLLGFFLLAFLAACSENSPISELQNCPIETQNQIEQLVTTGDGHGHGPDIGSDEWHGVIEFRLNLREQTNLPDWHSQAWCDFILASTDSKSIEK